MFKFEDNPFKNNKVTANNSQKYENFNNLTFKVKVIYEWRLRPLWLILKGYPWRLLCASLNTIHLKITQLQPITARTSEIWTFDLEGQGHLRMKVKVSVVFLKVLSQGLLWPSLKTIHKELKKLWSTYKFADGNGNVNANAARTITIPLIFFLQKKKKSS
jgi:hypothetical protein